MDEKSKEIFRKAIQKIKEKLDKGPPEGHLEIYEIRYAVYEEVEELELHKQERIICHLKRCKLCRNFVKEEQENNTIFQCLLKWREGGGTDDEYWSMVGKIKDELLKKYGLPEPKKDGPSSKDEIASKLMRINKFQEEYFARVAALFDKQGEN